MSGVGACRRERWRKDLWRGGARAEGGAPPTPQPALAAALAAEVSLTLLQALDTIVQVCHYFPFLMWFYIFIY